MAESKHTPGPFEVQDPMGSDDGLWVVQAGLEAFEWSCIAIVCRDEDRSGAHFITKAEQAENAQLFAAAPDLLEALKAMVMNDIIHIGTATKPRLPPSPKPSAGHDRPHLPTDAIRADRTDRLDCSDHHRGIAAAVRLGLLVPVWRVA